MPRVAPDNNDIIVWRLNDGGIPYVNSSTSPSALTANLVTLTGTVNPVCPSLFGSGNDAVSFPSYYSGGYGDYPSGASSTFNRLETTTGSDLNVAAPITVSGWVRVRSYQTLGDNYGYIFKKRYRADGSWTTPLSSLAIGTLNTQNGAWEISITVSGVRYFLSMSVEYPLPLGEWGHVGLTFDATTLNAYLNGQLAGTRGLSGAIDYGTHGSWSFGATGASSGDKQEAPADVCDWRIANVVRDRTYFSNIYRQGMLTW